MLTKTKHTKLTSTEWNRLNDFYQEIQPPAQNEMYASGDHYTLYLMLCNMGYRPKADAMSVYRLAEKVLANGYEK